MPKLPKVLRRQFRGASDLCVKKYWLHEAKLPRDVDGPQLVKALSVLGYVATRRSGSHIRVTTQRDGENHEVIPHHHPIKAGTRARILKRVAAHPGMTAEEFLGMLGL